MDVAKKAKWKYTLNQYIKLFFIKMTSTKIFFYLCLFANNLFCPPTNKKSESPPKIIIKKKPKSGGINRPGSEKKINKELITIGNLKNIFNEISKILCWKSFNITNASKIVINVNASQNIEYFFSLKEFLMKKNNDICTIYFSPTKNNIDILETEVEATKQYLQNCETIDSNAPTIRSNEPTIILDETNSKPNSKPSSISKSLFKDGYFGERLPTVDMQFKELRELLIKITEKYNINITTQNTTANVLVPQKNPNFQILQRIFQESIKNYKLLPLNNDKINDSFVSCYSMDTQYLPDLLNNNILKESRKSTPLSKISQFD